MRERMARAVRRRLVPLDGSGDMAPPAHGRRARAGLRVRLERRVDPDHGPRPPQRLPRDAAMSDFLSHLAARAISAPTRRPRTPSRFEPVSPPEEPVNDASPRERIVE